MDATPARIERKIRKAAELIRESHNTVVLTGAGISTPSGIPDFRSAESGLWTKFNPFEVASLQVFQREPQIFFNWIRPLAQKMINAVPNQAHKSLANLEKMGNIQTIITQNIDGLHQRAGSKEVLELHGSWERLTCAGCNLGYHSSIFLKPFLENGEIPYCPECGGVLRPNLILFGEQLPEDVWQKASSASQSCELMIVAGSSLEIYPAAGLPEIALDNRSKLIVINQSNTYIDRFADTVIQDDISFIIPLIAKYTFDR